MRAASATLVREERRIDHFYRNMEYPESDYEDKSPTPDIIQGNLEVKPCIVLSLVVTPNIPAPTVSPVEPILASSAFSHLPGQVSILPSSTSQSFCDCCSFYAALPVIFSSASDFF